MESRIDLIVRYCQLVDRWPRADGPGRKRPNDDVDPDRDGYHAESGAGLTFQPLGEAPLVSSSKRRNGRAMTLADCKLDPATMSDTERGALLVACSESDQQIVSYEFRRYSSISHSLSAAWLDRAGLLDQLPHTSRSDSATMPLTSRIDLDRPRVREYLACSDLPTCAPSASPPVLRPVPALSYPKRSDGCAPLKRFVAQLVAAWHSREIAIALDV